MAPLLSAIVVVGEVRDRAQQVLDRLNAQTAADSMEVVVVDVTTGSHPRLRIPPGGVPTTYIECSPGERWGEVKAAGVRAATAPVVAFVEDHSTPTITWAEAILRAASQPWVAAGYVFLNANPRTYVSRAGFITDYGEWAYPLPPGPIRHLPCNNMAYRREELVKLGDRLGKLLNSDVNLHEHLARHGKPVQLILDAVVAHQNHEQIGVLFEGNFVHCRVIGACRVEEGRWGWPRRVAYALAVPFVVPWMKLARLLRVQMRRPALWGTTLAALPVAMAVFIWSSLGESLGYLFGLGNALRRFQQVEVSVQRSAELNAGRS